MDSDPFDARKKRRLKAEYLHPWQRLHSDPSVPAKGTCYREYSEPATITVLLNDASGGLRPGNTFAVAATPHEVALGDFDEDRRLDVAVSCEGGGVSILLNDTH